MSLHDDEIIRPKLPLGIIAAAIALGLCAVIGLVAFLVTRGQPRSPQLPEERIVAQWLRSQSYYPDEVRMEWGPHELTGRGTFQFRLPPGTTQVKTIRACWWDKHPMFGGMNLMMQDMLFFVDGNRIIGSQGNMYGAEWIRAARKDRTVIVLDSDSPFSNAWTK